MLEDGVGRSIRIDRVHVSPGRFGLAPYFVDAIFNHWADRPTVNAYCSTAGIRVGSDIAAYHSGVAGIPAFAAGKMPDIAPFDAVIAFSSKVKGDGPYAIIPVGIKIAVGSARLVNGQSIRLLHDSRRFPMVTQS